VITPDRVLRLSYVAVVLAVLTIAGVVLLGLP
jgi:hypothetical protein